MDTILDETDEHVATHSTTISGSITVEQTIDLPQGLSVGHYYIFYKYDALDNLIEDDETDNIGYSVLQLDTVLSLPYINSFENDEHIESAEIELVKGFNRFDLPKNLASGVYLISIYNKNGMLTRKTIIQN